MKKIVFLTCLLVISYYTAMSQTTEERNLSPFDKLMVASEVKVFLTKGAEEKAKIIASGIELSEIETTISGKTLLIELSRGLHVGAKVEIYLTYKEIRDINVGASGSISVQSPLTGDKVVLSSNTNGELQAELNLKTVDVIVGQGAVMRLSGKTGSMDAKISTKGILSAIEMLSDSSYLRVSSAGIAKVTAVYLLDATVKTGGTLTYSGKPKETKVKKGIGAAVNVIE